MLPLKPACHHHPVHTIRPLWFKEAAHRTAEMDKGLSKRTFLPLQRNFVGKPMPCTSELLLSRSCASSAAGCWMARTPRAPMCSACHAPIPKCTASSCSPTATCPARSAPVCATGRTSFFGSRPKTFNCVASLLASRAPRQRSSEMTGLC